MYRSLFIVVLFAMSALTESRREMVSLNEGLAKCNKDHNRIQSRLHLPLTKPERIIQDPEQRCYAACIFTLLQILHEDGSLNVDYNIRSIPQFVTNPQERIDGYHSCANKTAANSCETAYESIMCVEAKKANWGFP